MGVKTQNHAAADVLIDGEHDGRGRAGPPGARRRGRRRHRHDRDAGVRRHPPSRVPGAVPEPGREHPGFDAGVVGELRRPLHVRRRLRRHPDRPARRASRRASRRWWTGSTLRTDVEAAEAALQAHADSGLRTVFVYAARRETREGEPVPPTDPALITRLTAAAGPTTTMAFGSVVPAGRRSDGAGARAGDAARELGLRIHAHGGWGSIDPGGLAAVAQLLGDDVVLAHCSRFDGADLDADRGLGRVRVPRALERDGGRPGRAADPGADRPRHPARPRASTTN